MASPEELVDHAISGQTQATHELFRHIYDDLRRVAAAHLAKESPAQTLTATALVHEAFLKLSPQTSWIDAAHLYRTSARAIRQILIDAARRKRSQKRGGGADRADIPPEEIPAGAQTLDPVEFHEAINRLEGANPMAAEVFSLRYFGGLTWEQIATALGVSVEKTESLWAYARAKLAQSLSEPA